MTRQTRIRLAALAVAAILAPLATPAVAHAAPAPTPVKHGKRHQPKPPPLPAPPRPPAHPITPAVGSATRTTTTSAATAARSVATVKAATGGTAATGGSNTLILYDTTGSWGWLGELYAEQTANLSSHFGTWTAHPVGTYTAGEMGNYSAVVYVGSTYNEPVPTAFLTDVLGGSRPVTWMYDNIWQLTAQDPTFATDYGWMWSQFDFSAVAQVTYKGTSLTRDTTAASGIMSYGPIDASKATVLANAVRPDGTTFPWALRSKNLTYIGEVPFSYEGMTDRYLAFSDLLFDALAPTTATRHRALARIEDVGPDSDPAELRSVADYLSSQGVPFSFGVYPLYRDPLGAYNNGVDTTIHLKDAPAVVAAIKYMISKGGMMIDHGYTHQYSNVKNPYTGTSADDFEFYTAHIDAQNFVRYDTPVPEDSPAWATGRLQSAAAEFTAAGLPVPTIFEFPHYAGSAMDYAAVGARFSTRYERALYFGGQLSGGTIDYTRLNGQFFPYVVNDLYGSKVLPEDIGNDEPEAFNNNPPRHPADIIDAASKNLVIRDGFASFFYHPYLGTTDLATIVQGIKGLGYTFVSPTSL